MQTLPHKMKLPVSYYIGRPEAIGAWRIDGLQGVFVQSCKQADHLSNGDPLRKPKPAQDKLYARVKM